VFAHALASDVPREAVKMNCRNDRLGYAIGILRDQACGHSGEYVSSASGRHARISRSVHPNRAVRLSNQSAVTLQHDNQIVIAGKCPCNIQPVVLYGSD
jgi:hypothetical protein